MPQSAPISPTITLGLARLHRLITTGTWVVLRAVGVGGEGGRVGKVCIEVPILATQTSACIALGRADTLINLIG